MKSGDLLLAGLGLLAIAGAGGAAAVIIASSSLADFAGDQASFARNLFEIVGRVLPQLSIRARILVVAQAAYESGWGSLGNGRDQTNNVFNVTAGSSWVGPTFEGTDKDGQGRPISQLWRGYESLDAAVLDWWELLGRLYPQARAALETGDVFEFSHQLVAGTRHYYSLAEALYTAQLAARVQLVQLHLGVSA